MESIQPIIARREVTTRILQAFHLKADKNLGQNFLVEESVVNRIAKVAELTPEDTVLEIGPGIGTLTQALALTGANVVSVELDKRLLPVLQETVGAYENVRIVQGDILKVNIPFLVLQSLRKPSLLHYYSHHHEPAGAEASVGTAGGDGAERSGGTDDRNSRRQGVRRYFRGYAVLHGTEDRVYRKGRFLFTGAQSGQRRTGVQTENRTAGGRAG